MKNWFKPLGWFYRPVSTAGFLLTLFLLSAFIHDFIFIDSKSHSVSDTYYHFAPYGFIYFSCWLWIASKTSRD
jgi:hypothetical protein